jgi:hypothetical protein
MSEVCVKKRVAPHMIGTPINGIYSLVFASSDAAKLRSTLLLELVVTTQSLKGLRVLDSN